MDSILSQQIKEVVVTGQLTERTVENAVHKIRVITGKKLKSGLFTDLGQALQKELNINLVQDNMLGSSASLQGLSGQNVKILIDDMPVIGRLNGSIDLSQISLNNIKRVEIIEGAMSTLYGTDALAGTINIITNKEPEFNQSFNAYYETVGKYNADFVLAKNLKNKTIIYQFERNYFNGWSENQKFEIIPTAQLANQHRFKQWKPKEQFINKAQYNLSIEDLEIHSYIESFNEKITNRGMPTKPYFENAFDEYYYTYRTNVGSNINFTNETQSIKSFFAYNKYVRIKEMFYKDLTTLSSVLVDDPSAQDTSVFDLFIGRAIISNTGNSDLQYQVGIETQLESAKGERILNTRQEQLDYSVFATIEYRPNSVITIRPAARHIHNTNYQAPFIPALNVFCKFNNYKLRFGIAKGFRAPSLKELFLEFVDINHNIVGNENLSAEESTNYQINNTYNYSLSNLVFKADLNIFYNEILNKIDLVNSSLADGQYSYFNVEKYKTQGITTNIGILSSTMEINIGASHIGRYNRLENSQSVPEFNFSTDYVFNSIFNLSNKNKLNILYKYVGKMSGFLMDGNNVVEYKMQPYSLLDFSVNRRVSSALTLSVGSKNLLNIKNINIINGGTSIHSTSSNSSPVGYGRTFFVSIKHSL